MQAPRKHVVWLLTILASLALSAPTAAQQLDFKEWAMVAGPFLLDPEIEALSAIRTVDQAARFIDRFWDVRDPDPTTTANEFRRTFQDRLAFVDKEFGEPGRRGCATPRGQVHMLLGPPDLSASTIRRFRVGGRWKPVEIWEYRDFGGRGRTLRFVFAHASDGVRFVVENPLVGLPRDLRRALATAREAFVRAPRSFVETAPSRQDSPGAGTGRDLPVIGRAVPQGANTVMLLEVDLHDLLGEPASHGILFRLDLEAARRHGPTAPLGSVELRIPLAIQREWTHEPARILVWLPGRYGGSIRLVEPLTGRSKTIEPSPSAQAPPEVAVARFLAVAPLEGGGILYAFFPPSAGRAKAVASIQWTDGSGMPRPAPAAASAAITVAERLDR